MRPSHAALKYNLDAKVKAMQVQVAHQQLDIAHYSSLPQVSANAGFDRCNNSAVEPFTSAEKNITSGNLVMPAWWHFDPLPGLGGQPQ